MRKKLGWWMGAALALGLAGCAEVKSIPVRLYPAVFQVPQSGLATVRVLDAAGNEVKVLLKDKALPPGPVSFAWDGRDEKGQTLEPGTYDVSLVLKRWDLKWAGEFGGLGGVTGKFLNPQGLCAYPQGARLTVAVADTGNQRVQLLTDTGAFLQAAGQFGTGDDSLNQPTDVDWDGLILTVCDSQNQRLARFDSRGIYLGEVRELTGLQVSTTNSVVLNFQTPVFIQKGSSGDFWVSDSGKGMLFHITSTGGILDEWGSPFSLNNDGPFAQVNGNFWIRTNKEQVQVINSTGMAAGSLSVSPAFQSVAGMAASPQGFTLISDSAQDLLYMLDEDGKVFQTWTPEGAAKPTALSLWNDQLFLIDSDQSEVVHYQVVPAPVPEIDQKITVDSAAALGGS